MTPPVPTTLGAFTLEAPVGRGGMGEVWAARHTASGAPVAVKLVTTAHAASRRFRAAFAAEVRAIARLDHPGIVAVHDAGRVTADEAAGTALIADSPYLVMDLLDGGSLTPRLGVTPWADARGVLLALLSALAHAHARGVVHRDLKPENVLWGGEPRRLQLTDFGLAFAADAALEGGAGEVAFAAAGTPAYMAPEQVLGGWRDLGPWTDLYAVGCLAYALVCGASPFARDTPAAAVAAQMSEPPPPLVPAVAVPVDLDAWIRALLVKDPDRRCRRAADAAFALRRLGEAVRPPSPTQRPSPVDATDPTLAAGADGTTELGVAATLIATAPTPPAATPDPATDATLAAPAADSRWATDATGAPPAAAGVAASAEEATPRLPRPPVPTRWRPLRASSDAAPLRGVGLGLFGLRPVPLVDREGERDALWAALRGVAEQGAARAVALTGPAGLGKSRLAEWLGEQAHALGAATPLRALHGPLAGPALGLGAMVERALGCVDLPRPDVVTRARAHLGRLGCLDQSEALALAELVRPALGAERATARLRFASPVERYLTIERWLGRLAAERPVLLWLDDAHHGREALDFTAHLLDAQAARPASVLVLLTARPDEAPSAEAERLAALLARPAVEHRVIGPLPDAARPDLVRAALGVEPSLAEAVDRRSEGNPLRVTQLLGDWVERGLLVPGPAGYRLTDRAALSELDDALAVVWARRVERLLAGRAADDGAALELAAVLGREVDGAEWLGACAEARWRPAGDLLEAALDHGLVQAEGGLEPADRWGFAHETLRAALRDRALAAGRLPGHHAACAAMLTLRAVPRRAERLGAHLRAAGRPAEAVPALLEAAAERLDEGDFAAASAQLDATEQALDEAVAGREAPSRGAVWVLRARIAGLAGNLPGGLALCDRAEREAAAHGWRAVAIDARHTAAELLLQRGEIGQARARVAEGLRLAEALGDAERVARCALAVAAAYVNQGDGERAAPLLRAAERTATARGDRAAAGRCAYWLSRLAEVEGDAGMALRHTERGIALFEEVGARGLAAACHNQRGDLLRAAGDLDGAEAAYERALTRWTAIGAGNAVYAQANRAQVMLERGAAAEARAQLDEARARFAAMGQGAEVAVCDVRLACCAALLGDGAGVDAALGAAAAGLTEAEQLEPDTARQLERVATLAEAAGWAPRAVRAWHLAARQWRALGRDAEAAAAEARASR